MGPRNEPSQDAFDKVFFAQEHDERVL